MQNVAEHRGRGRPKLVEENDRRNIIVAAAHQVFVEYGFAAATTERVAARAKVSKRGIYELFANKQELFAAVIREHRHLMLDLPRPEEEDIPLVDVLGKIFRLEIDEEGEREREAILNLIVRESAQFPELSDYLYDHGILRSREDLMEWLAVQARKGLVVIEDEAVCAGMLMDIAFGALLPRRRLKTAPDRAARRMHIRKRFEIFLRGVSPIL